MNDNWPLIKIEESYINSDYKNSIKNVFNNLHKNKLPDWILNLNGMSGRKYRQFINNLCETINNPRYLEIGCWKGSTLCSAMFDNNITAFAVDNWSEFNGPKQEFEANIQKCINESKSKINFSFKEMNYTNIDYSNIGKYNIYFFDGPHKPEDQYNALKLAMPSLEDEFIFICDDWNWDYVETETLRSIKDLNLNLVYSIDIKTNLEDVKKGFFCEKSDWHNGIFISVLKRN
jgi:hypothetical protein